MQILVGLIVGRYWTSVARSGSNVAATRYCLCESNEDARYAFRIHRGDPRRKRAGLDLRQIGRLGGSRISGFMLQTEF